MIPDTYLAPERLWLLLLLPVLIAFYVWRQRRRKIHALRFSAVPLLANVAGQRPGWRRHVIAAGLLLSLVPLIVAFARPAKEVRVPKERATIIVAIDVSLSMQAQDVAPDRLKAAQEAAKNFAAGLPKGFNLGLVSFSQGANTLVPPTTDRAQFDRAVDGLELGPYTAIGEAILTSLEALKLAPPDPNDPTKLPPATIVLLSDGSTTTGRTNDYAAGKAKEAAIPVNTIAFGTDEGYVEVEGQRTLVPVDAAALRKIADQTDGKAYEASSLNQLNEVYRDIGTSVGYELEPDEISARWSGVALVLLFASVAGSIGWFGRLP